MLFFNAKGAKTAKVAKRFLIVRLLRTFRAFRIENADGNNKQHATLLLQHRFSIGIAFVSHGGTEITKESIGMFDSSVNPAPPREQKIGNGICEMVYYIPNFVPFYAWCLPMGRPME